MDLSVTSITTAYQPQQAAVRGNGDADATQGYSTASGGKRQAGAPRAELAAVARDARKAREEDIRDKEPVSDSSRAPGFSFEYQDSHRVMKVHNVKGVFIYQVPSKGQLALVEADDNTHPAANPIRLTA